MVSTALYTGLSGLRVHQTYIDVIGNNLANVSTPGFRGSRATFSDILSFTVRSGAGPNGNFGGVNPLQIGTGAFMATVDMDTNQGTLQDTGRSLDVALQGRGFFTLTNGTQNFYSRVGSFGIDSDRTLVDLRTGLRVVNSTGGDITVPISDTLPAQQTSTVKVKGQLPAEVGGPLAEIVQSSAPLKQGTAATATTTASGASAPSFDLSGFIGQTLLVSVNGGAHWWKNCCAWSLDAMIQTSGCRALRRSPMRAPATTLESTATSRMKRGIRPPERKIAPHGRRGLLTEK
jgi:flagellar hook protein FlgE